MVIRLSAPRALDRASGRAVSSTRSAPPNSDLLLAPFYGRADRRAQTWLIRQMSTSAHSLQAEEETAERQERPTPIPKTSTQRREGAGNNNRDVHLGEQQQHRKAGESGFRSAVETPLPDSFRCCCCRPRSPLSLFPAPLRLRVFALKGEAQCHRALLGRLGGSLP